MPNLKTNKREQSVFKKYTELGYNCLTKGYPDFCFYKDKEVVFVEVKRKQKKPSSQMGLSKHQRKMIDIFIQLGLDVRIEYI